MQFAELDYAHYFQPRLSHTLRVPIGILGKRKTNNQDKRNQNEKPCYYFYATSIHAAPKWFGKRIGQGWLPAPIGCRDLITISR
jgi:hypothetical protein